MGFGYYGAIQVTKDGNGIQCHVCGKLFSDLNSHIRNKHTMSTSEYREQYQLARSTALISEKERMDRKDRTIAWLKTLSKRELAEMRAAGSLAAKKRRKKQPKESLETKNKKGTCPQQILEKIKEVKKKLGHTPSLAEFIDVTESQRYKHLIYKVYGSWNNALKILGIYEKKSHARKGKRHTRSNEELLEHLVIFAQENQRTPTHTDAKRGLIPDDKIYKRRFGSLQKARELAEVDKYL